MISSRRTFSLVCFVTACALTCSGARAAQEEEAVRVYKQLRPSIVSFENSEGSGTGIMLQADGLILTNAHVVSSPLPYEVKIDSQVAPDKPPVTLVFKKVNVVGYHVNQDMALVRIDPREHPAAVLKAATRSNVKAEPGQRVYVIGNPGGGGKILTKSISSGMVSAVDREVDGVRYYQTDAAINPGNSGGPMVDRNGNVIGMVTLKLNGVESIGFAIPLNDLDIKGFVPLTQRKGDPKQARKLVELGTQLLQMAGDSIKAHQGKMTDDTVNYLNTATLCFHDALSLDPANPLIFFDIGIMRQVADRQEAATAYFARAIQLSPWDELAGAFYVRLGMTLSDQKQENRAQTAWSEAVAKYPYSVGGWAFLAAYYEKHARPTDAARCAATALLIGGKELSVESMTKIIADARSKRAGAATIDRETTRDALIAALDQMSTASNVARRARTLYINKHCADMMAGFGGVPITDLEKNIAQKPVPPVAEWNLADGATPAPGAGGAAKPKPGVAAVPPVRPVAGNGKRVEVTVPSVNNLGRPIDSGVRLTRGQSFVLEPNPNDTWIRGKKDSPTDYRGSKKGDGAMCWKIGATSSPVVSGQTLAAPEDGSLLFYCKDGRPNDNTGSIRVTVIIK